MKRSFLLLMSLLLAGHIFAQIKSVAVINDVEDQLYLLKRAFIPAYEVLPYSCTFGQSEFAGKEMVRLLSADYKAELIELPAEYRKSRGLLRGSVRKWFKELNSQYDVVIYVYSCTKKNRRLFQMEYPLYSSGLINETFGNARNSSVYSTITARVYSTKSGIPVYHLDNTTFNATRQPLKKLTFVEDINNEEVCRDVSLIIQSLISARFQEFLRGFDAMAGEE